jgi:hypothetical protein
MVAHADEETDVALSHTWKFGLSMAASSRAMTLRPSLWPALAPSPALAVSGVGMLAFRWLVIACQAATLWITWPLWQHHDAPPMLPALALPSYDVALPLLVSLAIALFAPVLGLSLHTVLLVYAILVDQTRMQPELISLAFLLWGTLPSPTATAFARAHLISLWMFAGINKLVSPTFLHETAPWLLSGFPIDSGPWLHDHIGYIVAGTELTTGVLALFPATRLLCALVALGMHSGILLDLGPFGLDVNQSVWPWNLALAFAGFALIAPWKEPIGRSLGGCPRWVRPLIVILAVAPVGFHFGLMDAYLSHNLYSSNIVRATVRCTGECSRIVDPSKTREAFNVPMPPEPRLFEQYFWLTCSAGDELVLSDPRWWSKKQGLGERRIACPAGP